MTDTPTPPAATGSQAQEREALAARLQNGGTSKAWALDRAGGEKGVGWTRHPSGAGEEIAADLKWVRQRACWYQDEDVDQLRNRLREIHGRVSASSVTVGAALSLRGDAETDAPAAAEPQAGEYLTRDTLERLDGLVAIGLNPLHNLGFAKGQFNALVAAARRPTPATPAPASAPANPGVGALIGAHNKDRVRRFLQDHLGCTNVECSKALDLSVMAVGRHVESIRKEWEKPNV